jgi:hypothetical protein
MQNLRESNNTVSKELTLEEQKESLISSVKELYPKGYFDWLQKISEIQTTSHSNNNIVVVTSAEGAFNASPF